MLIFLLSTALATCPWKKPVSADLSYAQVQIRSETATYTYPFPQKEWVFVEDLKACRGDEAVAAFQTWQAQVRKARTVTGLVGLAPLGVVTMMAGDPGIVLGAGIGAGVNAGIQWRRARTLREAVEAWLVEG